MDFGEEGEWLILVKGKLDWVVVRCVGLGIKFGEIGEGNEVMVFDFELFVLMG